MADKRKPYMLPAMGTRSSGRLSRAEFEDMVRNMGGRAARDYMQDEAASDIRPNNRTLLQINQLLNRLPEDGSERQRRATRAAAETAARATGMKNGGIVKSRKVAGFKNGGCVMAGRGGKFKGSM